MKKQREKHDSREEVSIFLHLCDQSLPTAVQSK